MVVLKLLWFTFIAFFPLWFGIIGNAYVLISEYFENKEDGYGKR